MPVATGRGMIHQDEPKLSASAAIVLAGLVAFGLSVRPGFTPHALAIMVVALGLCIWLQFRPIRGLPSPETLLIGLLLAFLAVRCLLDSGLDETKTALIVPNTVPPQMLKCMGTAGEAIRLLGAVGLVIGLTFLARGEEKRREAGVRFALLILIALLQRPLMLASSPSPQIDVYVIQTEGSEGLFEGRNAYAMDFTPVYEGRESNQFAYPPASLYPVALAWKAFKDVRVAWIICDVLGAFFLYRLARRTRPESPLFARLLALAFLFQPRSFIIIEQSWTEPLIVACMGAFALAYSAGIGSGPLGLLMGLWLSAKQYVVLAVPFLIKLLRKRINVWLWAVIAGAVLTLPFALWDFHAMWEDLVTFYLKSEARGDALSLYALLFRHGIQLAWPVVIILWVIGAVLFTWRMPRTLPGMLFGVGCMWLYFFIFGKQAFMNYYYLISFAFFLAAAATPTRAIKA